jgi:hypothetical protein
VDAPVLGQGGSGGGAIGGNTGTGGVIGTGGVVAVDADAVPSTGGAVAVDAGPTADSGGPMTLDSGVVDAGVVDAGSLADSVPPAADAAVPTLAEHLLIINAAPGPGAVAVDIAGAKPPVYDRATMTCK